MPSLSSISDPKAYHILTYGTLLGSTFFQTFLGGPLAFKALPRPQFATLQQTVIPYFFALQTALTTVLPLTWIGEKAAAIGDASIRHSAGTRGLLAKENIWTGLVPIAIMFGTSLLNLAVLGPATTKVMKERKYQGMPLLWLACEVAKYELICADKGDRNKGREEVLRC
jgi:hypothetical protein